MKMITAYSAYKKQADMTMITAYSAYKNRQK